MKPKNVGDTKVKVYHDKSTDAMDDYTVVMDNNDIYAMSEEPYHPQYGFNQFVGQLKTGRFIHPKEDAHRVPWGEVPEGIKEATIQRLNVSDKKRKELKEKML